MMQAIAVDDEPLALEILENFCAGNDEVDLLKTFTRVSEAQKYLEKFHVDLLFLDIHMPMLSGIEFFKGLKRDFSVIFTTAHSQYAVQGFNLNAVDYLLKPFSKERFDRAVQKAAEQKNLQLKREQADSKVLYVRADYDLVAIPFQDILYIESFADYLKIFVEDRKPVMARMTMKHILEKLPLNSFLRVHRSYIIPVSRIRNIRNKVMTIGDKKIPIGITYEAAINEFLQSE